jgi:hypothetical protein
MHIYINIFFINKTYLCIYIKYVNIYTYNE